MDFDRVDFDEMDDEMTIESDDEMTAESEWNER